MTLREQVMTVEDFVAFATLLENEDRRLEFINGEIVEVMSPGRTRNSEYRDILAVAVHFFCRENQLRCHTSGEDGAYRIGDSVVVPDFAYKPTRMSNDYPDPVPPLWVVEVISPTDKAADIRQKREVYLRAGILYWEMYPQLERIDVYPPGQPARTLGIDDVLDGGDVLPGFQLPVRDLLDDDDEGEGQAE
jgi:Uma2 family endonuclease